MKIHSVQYPAYLTLLLYFAMPAPLFAQQRVSGEELFQQARELAFHAHDQTAASARCREALQASPNDPDIRIFLGRLYAWNHSPDSARAQFDTVLAQHPGYEDAYTAYADLETWNDQDARGLKLCSEGLRYHPGSIPLLQRRASLLANLRRYREAKAACDSLLALDPKNATVRALQDKIRDYSAGNKVGIAYDYVYFDRQYDAPWHLLSAEYTRQTAIGSVVGRVNYANRFRTGGVQFEADAYPRISRMFYAYVNAGYSADDALFPRWRGGASLYANLPHAFEADAGLRYLHFSNDTWLYTFSLGKYYKNFWFNARAYLVPGNSTISQSLTLTARYYTGGADDYIYAATGTGISPDDRSNSQQLASPYKLRSHKAEAGWRHSISKLNILFANVQWLRQEYLPKTSGNQVDIGIGYQRRF